MLGAQTELWYAIHLALESMRHPFSTWWRQLVTILKLYQICLFMHAYIMIYSASEQGPACPQGIHVFGKLI